MPYRSTAKLKESARRLLAYESASGQRAGAKDSPAFRVCEKLRGPLGKLMGTGGFHSLLARALSLAIAEVPWLHTLQILADGSLAGLNEPAAQRDARAVAEGEVVLVAQLLGLLVTFIGPALTQGLLHDVWPKLDDLNFEEEKHYAEKK